MYRDYNIMYNIIIMYQFEVSGLQSDLNHVTNHKSSVITVINKCIIMYNL